VSGQVLNVTKQQKLIKIIKEGSEINESQKKRGIKFSTQERQREGEKKNEQKKPGSHRFLPSSGR